jgi:preprotein translocase subunit SecE
MAEMHTPPEASPKDTVLMSLSVLAILGGIWAFYWFDDQGLALRAVMVVAGVLAGLGMAWFSWYGREFWQFALAARVELRKVVWPEREETIKTTVVVMVFAFLMGLFFFLLDLVLTWMTRFLSGQTG